jgi:nitrite reductase (NADH) large subunit
MTSGTSTPHKHYDYLIVGNSAAGIAGAEAIRSLDETGTVGIVSDEDWPAYSTPAISYLVKGDITAENMHLRPDDFYDSNHFDCIFGKPAVAIDAEAHELELSDGRRVGYGKLLLACGSVPSTPPVEGLEGQSNVHHFTRVADAIACIDQAKAAMRSKSKNRPVRAIVIGGGLIGLKAAEGLSQRVDEVVVLVRRTIMRSILDDEAAKMLTQQLLRNNVLVRTQTEATKVHSKDGRVVGVDLKDGGYLDCDLLVIATGERPNCQMAVDAGAEADRGLLCKPTMQTSLPDVYAAGDCASSYDVLDRKHKTLMLWPNAMLQGKVAGTCMAGGNASYEGSFAINAVGFFDMSILACGMIKPQDESYTIRTSLDNDRYRRFILKDDRLYGYLLVNSPENAGIYTFLVRNKIPLSQLVDDVFGENGIHMIDLPDDVRLQQMHNGLKADGRNQT